MLFIIVHGLSEDLGNVIEGVFNFTDTGSVVAISFLCWPFVSCHVFFLVFEQKLKQYCHV